MVLMEFSMSPLGQGESVSPYVMRSLKLIEASGLDYQLNSMGTVVEGELNELLPLLERCFEAMSVDCNRITCSVKFDFRNGHQGRLQSKVAKIEQLLADEASAE